MTVIEVGAERWVVLRETGDAKNREVGSSNSTESKRLTD